MSIQMQAEDFFNAYLVLHENNHATIEKLSNAQRKPLVGMKEQGTCHTGGVNIVCLAFSVELYIKDLHYAVKGKTPRGHNILNLFEELPEQIQKEIFDYESISQNPFCTRGDILTAKKFTSDYSTYNGFIDQIKAISDGFEKWRYSYESGSLRYETFFALAFIESVKAATSGVRKHSNNSKQPEQPGSESNSF